MNVECGVWNYELVGFADYELFNEELNPFDSFDYSNMSSHQLVVFRKKRLRLNSFNSFDSCSKKGKARKRFAK